ncbi:GNAT family N-acetyltransferase [Nocardia asteroides NBRC 15531]|uniref:bifunctional acetate--CoA ligase family protein/GNAT family N-acetyltransferase n=1 Tax=Nocardia asteroides TaxID=1824 RepID=UPI0002F67755|nr:bifunctional GNAT family N-acetyltransferase/acetate--CoA ligase family protein [Nocardia asteroides]TLF64482.1 GNAT family N-acetyltransferase [Nocardia asteroides NBRC 15531]UGT50410.1 GNAT family N-acetyltransferase [Nocardia asteroides]SFN09517.1 Acyl-CoA synthetase (NDP forming) [Nocardia asteroides]VEG36797.1 succinyl-CoA synthetase subunit alpha [Nocardia asteroides]
MTEPLLPDTPDTPANPPAPPQHWYGDVLASDGGVVRVRPIMPADAPALAAFHTALSDRTRYLRYFGPYPQISPKDMYRTTHVDYHDRVGLVAVLGDAIIGVARYELLDRPGPRAAEVAFVVADEHQGRGLGSVLLEHLAGAAAENDMAAFVAEVLAENEAMITVFRDAGYQLQRSRDGAEVHLEFAIDPTEALRTVRDAREAASEARSVGNLLAPGSVAVIGASPEQTRVGGAVLANLIAGGFSGPIFPVNPNRRSVRGVRAYATVREIPDEVDLAVVAVPPAAIGSVLDDCMAKGVKGLVVLTAGFGETGPEGLAAEQDLVAAARGHGMRVVGPSALGIANTDPAVGLNATLASVLPDRGRIGFFCQSGPLGAAILGEAAARNLGLSTFVSAGNRADVSGNDLLQFWDTAADTEVILLYLESFGNPRKFSRLARRVARGKPIVAVSSGRLAAGTDMDRTVVRDLFTQAGIIQVDSISELFDCAALLACQPLPRGPRVAVVGNSAALNWLAIDAAHSEGLRGHRPATAVDRGPGARPTERSAGTTSVDGPVDLGPEATPADYREAVQAALRSDEVDAVIVVVAPPVAVPMAGFADALRAAAASAPGKDKPVLTTFVAESGIPKLLAVRSTGGAPGRGSIPSYPDPERAARALARAERYARWRDRPVSPVVRPPGIDTEAASALVAEWFADSGGRWLTDEETARLLDCYGIDVVDFRAVRDAEQAVAAAEELGYPVAAKATGALWRRRPDLLGVRLDLWTPDAVRQAYGDLVEICGDPLLHVQKMATKGMGCVLRVTDDPSFGSVIEFGLSGMIIELLGDRAFRALPLTAAEAVALIEAPRAAPLLSGGQAGPAVDKAALAELAQRISALFDDIPLMRELSCDPVLAAPSSAEIIYARARIGPEPSRFDTGPRRLA